MRTELNIGDKVKIRPDIDIGRYGVNSVVDSMLQYRGKIATIVDVCERRKYVDDKPQAVKEYIIDLDDRFYSWTLEMFNLELSDDDLFEYIESALGINEEEIKQDYISNNSDEPTKDALIAYAKNKFKQFL